MFTFRQFVSENNTVFVLKDFEADFIYLIINDLY